ncbi:uncharacterized protein C8R40DRAFT_1170083 [Lentinula edodes]|uniref:uncharacterized protein n=1 Tax=Lentinula edodes TaxID=5353 RepID=UPI001E8CA86D|nr:uncharacterized protein C8R40DRAFT_1170083 [Lentinula edodes]KAH7875953.1 hypothetical protein C8R40DRAFT_1170083 [Lentinula edodes]
MDRQASTSPIVSVPSFDGLLPPVDIIPLRVPLSPFFLYTQLRAVNSHSQYRLDDHRDGLNDAGFPPESAFIVYRKSISSGERNKELKITYFAEYEAFFNILQGQPWSSQQQLSEIRLVGSDGFGGLPGDWPFLAWTLDVWALSLGLSPPSLR